jgi:hypothetical protein
MNKDSKVIEQQFFDYFTHNLTKQLQKGEELMNKDSKVIEQQFFDYFTRRGFKRHDESPLVSDDPDLLYTIAGMIPFKPYYEGTIKPPTRKIVTSQRCIRKNDIHRVGETKRHLTGFTMLGHFQFGKFDKREVLEMAFKLVTQTYGISPDRLIITCHPGDIDTQEIWRTLIGEERLVLLEDNVWESGEDGLMGYCTEFYYDFEPEKGLETLDLEGDRFLEFYNIVFIFISHIIGDEGLPLNLPRPLKLPGIDGGIGLERLTYILGDYQNVYEVLGDRNPVIEDHTRTCQWILDEGIKPSNSNHGYVLRQLMRRLFKIKEFKTNSNIFNEELQEYQKALERGTQKLDSMPNPSHEDLVNLYKTYDIPIDVSLEILTERKHRTIQEERQQLIQDPSMVKPGTEINNYGRLEVGAKVLAGPWCLKTGTIKEISSRGNIVIQWDKWNKWESQKEWYYPWGLLGDHKLVFIIPAFRLGDVVTYDNQTWIIDAIASEILYLQHTESPTRISRAKWQCEKVSCAVPLSCPDNVKPYDPYREYSSARLTLRLYYNFKYWLDTEYPHFSLVSLANNERGTFKAWEDKEGELWKIMKPGWPESDILAAWDRAFNHRIQELKENEGYKGVRLGDRITQGGITGTVIDIDEFTGGPIMESTVKPMCFSRGI